MKKQNNSVIILLTRKWVGTCEPIYQKWQGAKWVGTCEPIYQKWQEETLGKGKLFPNFYIIQEGTWSLKKWILYFKRRIFSKN